MSDIGNKTLPRGSRAGNRRNDNDDTSQADAPRSVASTQGLGGNGEHEENSEFDSGDHYTHQKSRGLGDDNEEQIRMNSTSDDQGDKSLEEVDPEPIADKAGRKTEGNGGTDTVEGETVLGEPAEGAGEAAGDAADTIRGAVQEGEQQTKGQKAKGKGVAADTASTAGKSGTGSLTEHAKQLFDLASQNQPTTEARDNFLQTAQSTAAGLSRIGSQKPQSQTMAEEESQAPDEEVSTVPEGQTVSGVPEDAPEGWEDAATHVDSEGTSVAQTAQPTDQQTVTDRTATDQQTVTQPTPSQFGSRAPTGQTQEQDFAEAGTDGADAETRDTQFDAPEGTVPSTDLEQQLQGDYSVLAGGRVNKGGNVVGDDGKVVGRVCQGILQYLIGKRVDEEGRIWSDSGKVIGRAEPLSDSERDDMAKEPAPFESFPDAMVDGEGFVVSNGERVGKVIEGDIQVLRGKAVDADGDILDRGGNVLGKAVRWEPEPEPEAEPEAEVDRSILAGKRVNKAGNVVDNSGTIYGRVVEGDVRQMVGRMCDKNGNILSESGDVLGRAEIVTEGEREGLKEGPFAELQGCTVAKNGHVVTPSGDIVGRLISGDPKILFGRAVDEDGDVLDRNGNTLGKAERWEPEEVERKKNPMTGRRVNREGNVVDEDGNIIGKLTSGNLQICSGKEIDDDGDVVDFKGTVIGHCSLLDDIPPEEGETEDEKATRERMEQDKKLAIQMAVCIEQCLDKIRPICKMINEKIDKAERTPEDERDEEQLVREVRPLIEEGGRILTEAKGIIKGLDPDGRISANAKHKTAAREATPEEYHLADVLKDLTGDVTQCIEDAKRKLEDMPHAKKELNPLWGLLNEPLFQILAAVGLLLNGVLSLVGRLLSGLGLGGLLDGLLGTLGINRVLEGLGLGQVTKSLTGQDGKKKKSGGGGLLGGLLGG